MSSAASAADAKPGQQQKQEQEQQQPDESVSAAAPAEAASASTSAHDESKSKKPRRAPRESLPVDVKPGEVPPGFSTVTEGSVTVLLPPRGSKESVFYNKVQVKNRDLSTMVLNAYAEQLEYEAHEQISRCSANFVWRHLPPTRDTWGPDFAKGTPREPVGGGGWRASTVAPHEAAGDGETADGQHSTETGELIGMRVLEALGASGLRSLRYAKEITEGVGLEHVIINDVEAHAVESARRNANFNGLGDDPRVVPNQADAVALLLAHRCDPFSKKDHSRIKKFLGPKFSRFDMSKDPFDVIDLDPYGSPSPFLDGAVQAVRSGGLLCVTATDLAALCGSSFEKCFPRYRAMPLRTSNFAHEMALRIVLGTLETTAAAHGRHIVPLLSVRMDFYIRLFVRVYENGDEARQAPLRLAHALHSRGCDAFFLQPLGTAFGSGQRGAMDPAAAEASEGSAGVVRAASWRAPTECAETGAAMAVGGPIWSGPLHNQAFVKALLKQLEKPGRGGFDASKLDAAQLVHGVLAACADELPDPFYYMIDKLARTLHCVVPPLEMVQFAIVNAGYKVSRSHTNDRAVKTNAPPGFIWDVMRAWCKTHPVAEKHLEDPQSTAAKILSKEPSHEISFASNDAVRSMNRRARAVSRWKPNPERDWGPKRAAAGSGKGQTHRRRGGAEAGSEGHALKRDSSSRGDKASSAKRSKPNTEDWKDF